MISVFSPLSILLNVFQSCILVVALEFAMYIYDKSKSTFK